MKRILAIVFCVAFVAVSCGKDTVSVADTDTVRLSFAAHATTRAAEGYESMVNALDVLIFRGDDGTVEGRARFDGASAFVDVVTGVALEWHVVANAPEGTFDEVSSLDSFLASVYVLENNGNGMVMHAQGHGVFHGDADISVTLERVLSKVTLGKVVPSFLGSTYAGSEVYVERIFLVNVDGICLYNGGTISGGVWYNRMGLDDEDDDVHRLFVRGIHARAGVSDMDFDVSLYCCPNPVDNGIDSKSEPLWCARNTRLVIEVSVDGEANYYPLTLGAMEHNTEYVFSEVRLLGPGAESPDMLPDRDAFSFDVAVNPWIVDREHELEL